MDSTPLRRCRTPACTMASYLVQDSGYCSKCEQREDPRQWAFSEDRDMRRGASFQEPVKDSPSAIHQRKPSFNEGLSPAYKRHSRLANDMQSPLLPPAMESRPGLAASSYVSNLSLQSRSQQAPRRSDHGALQGRDMVVTANNFQFQMPTEQSLTGSMPAQQQASYYRGLVSNAGLSRLFPSAATPPAPPSGPQVRPTSRMMLRASPSMREAPSGPSQVTQSVRRSRSAGFPPSGELRRGSRSPYTLARPAPERSANRISFAAEPAKPTPGCQTPNCGAASYLIQANGFCTACNTKAKLHGKLRHFQAPTTSEQAQPIGNNNNGNYNSRNYGSGLAVTSNAFSSMDNGSKSGAEQQEVGTAFGGRLQYSFVRKNTDGHVVPGGHSRGSFNLGSAGRASAVQAAATNAKPKAAVVDYQYLRLKFLLNKAIGQGVDPLEIFEHFDTDFSGEIDVPEFVDGLKRLGIYLTNAENLALLQRFSIQDGAIQYKDFIAAMGLDAAYSNTQSSSTLPPPPPQGALRNGRADSGASDESAAAAPRRSSLKGGISFDEDALSKTPGGKAQRRRTPSRDRIVDSSGGEPDTTPDGALTDASLEQMVMDIHAEINRLAKSKKGKPKFTKVFSSIDTDGSGEIDLQELLNGLTNMGFELSTKQAEQIAKVFDTDNSGAVDYHEFVAFCEASDVREAVRMSKQVKKRKKRVSIASAK